MLSLPGKQTGTDDARQIVGIRTYCVREDLSLVSHQLFLLPYFPLTHIHVMLIVMVLRGGSISDIDRKAKLANKKIINYFTRRICRGVITLCLSTQVKKMKLFHKTVI